MSLEPRLVFLNSQNMSKVGYLEALLDVFGPLGFDVHTLKVGNYKNVFASWDHYPDSDENKLAVAYQYKQLKFDVSNKQESFDLFVQLGWGKEHLGKEKLSWLGAVCFQTPLFNYEEGNPAHYSRLYLDIAKRVYEVLQPRFGWLDMSVGLADDTSFEDVEVLALPHLYWANFFSAAYVEKIGRNHILNAPAWSIEDLADGGLLYVLSSGPGLASEEDHVSVEAVKKHFGIQSVR